MPDTFTTTTTTGYGKRIVGSFQGVIFGFILFIASFYLLYWNEGRQDFSLVAKTAVDISALPTDEFQSLTGKLVSVTGPITSNSLLGDDLFLKPGNYVSVSRISEMYSWTEKVSTKSHTNVGGSETTETTYNYTKAWKESPPASDNFTHPEGHANPPKAVDDYVRFVRDAMIGPYGIGWGFANPTLPYLPDLPLNENNVTLKNGARLADGTYLFIGYNSSSTYAAPFVGDIRVSYKILENGKLVTVFGSPAAENIAHNVIVGWNQPNESGFFRLLLGTRDDAIAEMHSEYTTLTWILRIIGFLMMWFGLMAIMGPISVVLDFLPFLGGITRGVISIAIFLVSLILTPITILVSNVAHSLVAVAVTAGIALVAAAVVFLHLHKKKKAALAAAPPASPVVPPPPPSPQA